MKGMLKRYLLFVLSLVTLLSIGIYLVWSTTVCGSYETGREIHYFMSDERLATMNEIRISDYKATMK